MQTSRRPLDGARVVVTRPRARDQLARALRARGARVVFAPLVRIAPPASFAALDAALRRSAEFDACAFASAAAVESFFARARRVRVRPRRPSALLAVGPATAAALAARGWRGAVVPRVKTGAALARALRAPKGKRVLLPQAAGGREELGALLAKAGARVTRVDAYRTLYDARGAAAFARAFRPAPKGCASAACFASPSAARAAKRALGARARRFFAQTVCAAIGPTTAAELRRLGARRVAVARAPSAAALAEALADILQ